MLSAIVLAAGKGLRLGAKIPKPLVKINKKPLLNYSLSAFESHPAVGEIIVVYGRKIKKQVIQAVKAGNFKKVKGFIEGGKRRQDSVFNGLKAVSENSRWVLIHDCARPFIDKEAITGVVKQAKKRGAAILGVPVKATVKSAEKGKVTKTLKRSSLWEIQTPQVFDKKIILSAYDKFSAPDATDDASLVEKLGKKVYLVPGKYANIKITTAIDLLFAQAILKGIKNAS